MEMETERERISVLMIWACHATEPGMSLGMSFVYLFMVESLSTYKMSPE